MRARLAATLVALVTLLAGAVASATTMRALDAEALATQADVVLLGDVLSVGEVVVPSEGRLVPRTVYRIGLVERLVGAVPETISVVEPEGRLGTLVVHREGLAGLRRGQRVLLFLRREGSVYRPVGHAQGALVVRHDAPSDETRLERASDPGVLLGSTKARGVDLDARPSLDSVVTLVRAVREAP